MILALFFEFPFTYHLNQLYRLNLSWRDWGRVP